MKRTLLILLLSGSMLLPALGAFAQDEPPPADERVSIRIRLSEEHGGGIATVKAGDFEYQEDLYLLATGGMELKYKDLKIEAERARLEIPTNQLTAEGNVIVDQGPERMTGSTLEYDLTTQTGRLTDATAAVDPGFYFSGSQIAKLSETTYSINDGVFTSCEQEVPSWSLHTSDAEITIDEYARLKNARLKFGKVPVLYSPYILWPANTERSSGLLVPKPGFSSRRGAQLSLAYFKTVGRSADTTFFFDLATEGYFGLGNEIRYRPSENSEGYFKGLFISEPDDIEPRYFNNNLDPTREPGDDRWKVEYFHKSEKLWGGFRGVVDIQKYSDFDYLQDYERNLNRQTRSVIASTAYLTRNFRQASFNVRIDDTERIEGPGRSDKRRQLPEVEYTLRPTQLGKLPIYLTFDSSVHYFSVDKPRTPLGTPQNPIERPDLENEYGRADFSPQLSIPVSTLTWLSAEVTLGGRATYYSDSLCVSGADGEIPIGCEGRLGEFSGDTLTRVFPRAGLDVVGPVFTRIFEKKKGRFAKLKHIIEPRLVYNFIDDFEEQDEIFRFDEIDILRPINGWTFSLINRLKAKPREEDGESREIATFELRQAFSLDDDLLVSPIDPEKTSKSGPLRMLLRVNPSDSTSFRTELSYNTLLSQPRTLSVSWDTRFGGRGVKGADRRFFGHDLRLTWFSSWSDATGDTTDQQAQLATRFTLLPGKVTFDAEASFDVENEELQRQRYILNWKSQCFGWQLEYRENKFGTFMEDGVRQPDRDVRLLVTLKNVGTFLDINESF